MQCEISQNPIQSYPIQSQKYANTIKCPLEVTNNDEVIHYLH